jgi:hypothetical protein
MKKTLLILCLALAAAFTAPSHAQTGSVTLNFTLGELQDATGAALADGALLQVVSLSSGSIFGGPTAESFLGGNEILLWSGVFDSTTTGAPGAMLFSFSLTVHAVHESGLWAREFAPVLIRWYPTLTSSDALAAPGAVAYGEYGAGVPGWVIPAAGGLADLTFLTESLGGTEANALGAAGKQIAAVPEPGAVGLMSLVLLGGLALARRRAAI